jgi:two-component system, LytTR family, response regulator
MTIRTIIVDDEPHAREGIRLRLQDYPDLSIVAECASGNEAVQAINTLQPELVFLDIQMPELNGFEVLQHVTLDPMPIIIFVTAFDRYAIRAFDFHALGYLLKPISEPRFAETMKVALGEISHRSLEKYGEKLKALLQGYLEMLSREDEKAQPASISRKYPDRIMVKLKDVVTIVRVGEIYWIESGGDYVYIHLEEKKHILREALASLEQRLDPGGFVRIHRTAIVNVEKIKHLRTNDHGDYDIHLTNGVRLRLGRTYRAHFQEVVGRAVSA